MVSNALMLEPGMERYRRAFAAGPAAPHRLMWAIIGLKGGCLAAILSYFKWFVCHYFFVEGSASERRQP